MGKGARNSGGGRARNRERSQRAASYAAPTPAIRGSYPQIMLERIKAAVGFDGRPFHEAKKAKKPPAKE